MGNQQAKERRSRGRRIDWDSAEKPSPPGKPYLIPDSDEQESSDFITIRWAPPVSDGGAPIIGYVVEHRRTGSPHWLRAIPHLATETKLTLAGLEPGWRYQFRASAENDVGRSPPGEISEVLTVTSQRTAATSPHFNVELRDTIALENEKVEFAVHVVAIPQAKISWYKDGFEVFSSRRMKIVTENDQSTFIIHQAALEDEGEIKCTATNRAGHSVTRAVLKLEAPPRIRLPRQYEDGLIFEKGELIRLKVTTAGRPTPAIAWYHDGELIEDGDRCEIQDAERMSSLRISEAERSDRGEYVVRGVNKIGEDSASFLVTVTDRPMPPSKPKVAAALGRSVTLSWESPEDDGGCKIGSYTVEYFRVGWNMWLKAATCRQLSTALSELIEGSEYKFRVKAENPYGMSDPSEESDVIFVPDPKRGLLTPPPRPPPPPLPESETRKVDPWPEDAKEASPTEKRKTLEETARRLLDEPERRKRKEEEEEEVDAPPPVPKRRHKQRNTPSPCPPPPPPPRPQPEREMFHGSSELMLVLLPEEGAKGAELSAQQRSEIEMSLIGAGVAPPMSLSAPELGSDEPLAMPLARDAVSSTELLHERAMSRMYQDAMDEERLARRRYSTGERRSAERRASLGDGSLPERRHSFKGGLPSPEEPPRKRMSSVEREQMEFAIVRERIRLKNEGNLRRAAEEPEEEEEEEEEEEYLDEEDEEEEEEEELEPPPVPKHRAPRAEEEEEDVTYPPMTSRIVLPRLEITLPPTVEIPEPEPEPIPESPQVLPEEEKEEEEEEKEVAPVKKGKKRAANLLTKLGLKKEKKVLEIVVEADTTAPKPILKNKLLGKKGKKADKAREESRTAEDEDGAKKKKVRIAEPSEDVADVEVSEDQQATQVLICHYSDIVREFGQGKKPPTKQYMNCEEMKAAAGDQVPSRTPTAESLVGESTTADGPVVEATPPSPSAPPTTADDAVEEAAAVAAEKPSATPSAAFRSSFDYVTDVAMFLFACWLYVFSNELYAVPVLCLMAYRQVSEAAREKYLSLKAAVFGRWRRQKP